VSRQAARLRSWPPTLDAHIALMLEHGLQRIDLATGTLATPPSPVAENAGPFV